jgi:hypothetical protein
MGGEYEVGYRRPPKHSRFRKGRSGNSKGRPKGMKNFRTELREELQQKVRIREGNAEHVLTKQRAVLKRLVNDALKGDVRAIRALIELRTRYLEDDVAEPINQPLNTEEREIFEALITLKPEQEQSAGRKTRGRGRKRRRHSKPPGEPEAQ